MSLRSFTKNKFHATKSLVRNVLCACEEVFYDLQVHEFLTLVLIGCAGMNTYIEY